MCVKYTGFKRRRTGWILLVCQEEILREAMVSDAPALEGSAGSAGFEAELESVLEAEGQFIKRIITGYGDKSCKK